VEQAGGNALVAIAEDLGRDLDEVADGGFGGEATAIDLGADPLDDDSLPAAGQFFVRHGQNGSAKCAP
jgi:hypothetical protein